MTIRLENERKFKTGCYERSIDLINLENAVSFFCFSYAIRTVAVSISRHKTTPPFLKRLSRSNERIELHLRILGVPWLVKTLC